MSSTESRNVNLKDGQSLTAKFAGRKDRMTVTPVENGYDIRFTGAKGAKATAQTAPPPATEEEETPQPQRRGGGGGKGSPTVKPQQSNKPQASKPKQANKPAPGTTPALLLSALQYVICAISKRGKHVLLGVLPDRIVDCDNVEHVMVVPISNRQHGEHEPYTTTFGNPESLRSLGWVEDYERDGDGDVIGYPCDSPEAIAAIAAMGAKHTAANRKL